jgi:2-polyprenyl-3-methyl-5-hydroxy-6-metoxy-1,4-benzoquinol methylase
VLKRLASPLRNYFNLRFGAVHESIVRGHEDDYKLLSGVASRVDELMLATGRVDEDLQQTLVMIGRTIDELGQKVDALTDGGASTYGGRGAAELAERLDHVARRTGLLAFDPAQQGELAQLDEYEATVANYAYAHDGWAAQAGLWFNPAISIGHAAGGVALSQVNERIAEIPFVFRQLAGLPTGARVLDIGCTESTVALSLASLGYDVTAVDPRPYPLSHPRLTTFQGPIAKFRADEPFDAVVLLSSIEHFGVGAYQLGHEDDADLAAMARVWELSRPGTRLVLTTPFGDAPTTDLERTYDPARLSELLKGWKVEEQSYLTRDSATVWHWHPEIEDLRGDHVVLVTATRAEERA